LRQVLVAAEAPAGACVQFVYSDADENITKREVEVYSNDNKCFKGYCHLAGAPRMFRFDRIIGEVADLDTGEILSVKKWKRRLGA
jgi:predicted DNA-binding transcriptional regulator YafY